MTAGVCQLIPEGLVVEEGWDMTGSGRGWRETENVVAITYMFKFIM
jgi:hypothetical protein